MDFDYESGLIFLSHYECNYTGIAYVVPVEESDIALSAVMRALTRTNSIDISEFPEGSMKDKLSDIQQRETELARSMIVELLPHVESSVVAWAEAITRGE